MQLMFNKENIKKLFFIIINITFLMILITKMLSHFDLTDESQKFIKLYYFVVEDKYFGYDYNIHQAYFFILYPVLKLIYLLNQEILINNFIIINKSFYLLTLISIFYYLFFKLKKYIEINSYLLFFIVSMPFFSISKDIFFFTYDSILSLLFFYFFILIIQNKLNTINSTFLTIIAGLSHPLFGFFFLFILSFYINNKKKIIHFYTLVILLTLIITIIIFYFEIISFRELFISLSQSSEMSNLLILGKPKQLFLLFSICICYLIIKFNEELKIKKILIQFYHKIEFLLFTIIIFVIFSKYYIYVSGLILIQLYLFSFFNRNGSNLKSVSLIFEYGLLGIIILSFVSGNSLTKISIIAIPLISSFLLLHKDELKILKFKFYFLIIFIFIFFQSIFFQYRDGSLFTKNTKITTRFGDIFISESKAVLYNNVRSKILDKNFNNLTVIGSAPWIYLIDDYKPITKNLFFDIKTELFFDYLSELKPVNFIVIERNQVSNNYISKLDCINYSFEFDISEVNKLLNRKYETNYSLCKKN